MATNQITINFSPCSPAISYRVFYREIGDVSFIEWPVEFTSSPIVFEVEGPEGQLYEGYIVSVCEGDVIGPEVPWTGEPPISGEPGCCDPDVIDAVAETIIPDGSGSSSVGSGFLRLVYNVNMSGETVSDWNTFFGTAIFDSVVYSAGGTVVDLYTSGTMAMPGDRYFEDTTILKVLDFADCVTSVEGHAFLNAENLLEIDLPACATADDAAFASCSFLNYVNIPLVTIINAQLFAGCSALTNPNLIIGDVTFIDDDAFNFSGFTDINFPNCTFAGVGALRTMPNLSTVSLPSCTSVGIECFRGDNSITSIDLSSCTTMGPTTGDDDVFLLMTGNTLTLTIPTATATDGDVVTLQANNTVTLILV